MDDYESKYKEYKQSILQNRWLIRKLHEKYQGSQVAEKDYIDENGVLWKIGLLGAVFGFCLALTFALRKSGLWLLGAILFIALIGSLALAQYIGSKFKKNLGEVIFYAFQYHHHFEEHIQKDKDDETKNLMSDVWKYCDSLMWRSDSIPNMSKEDLESLLFQHIKKMADYQKRYQELNRYDRFADELKNDYHFNCEIQKDIDKYL